MTQTRVAPMRSPETRSATSPWISGAFRSSMVGIVVSLVGLLVLTEVVSVIFALQASRRDPRSAGGGVRLTGPAAESRGWPILPPSPGPLPNIVDVTTTFGASVVEAQHVENGVTTHAIEAREFGWPLPVLRTVREAWPDPASAGAATALKESGLHVVTAGLLLNPLLVGGLLWLALLAPLVLVLGFRRWSRTIGGRCATCGYATRGSFRCPECGAVAGSVT